jgi:hypothetical protein
LTLSSKLEKVISEANSKVCKFGAVLYSPKLSDEDRKRIEIILSVPYSNPSRVPNTTLARLLREEGYDVSNSAVDRHRRGDCPCKRLGK